MPERIQLKRTKGWRLQEASVALNGLPAVKVTRPGKFGNPFVVDSDLFTAEAAVRHFRTCLTTPPTKLRVGILSMLRGGYGGVMHFANMLDYLPELRGKNLACWCRLDGKPCHADALLLVANQ